MYNPCFCYYNINSLRFKIEDIKEIIKKSSPDILVFAETKIDSSFTNAQFSLNDYFEPTRKDFTCNSGGIIEFVKRGTIRRRLIDLELKSFESIASEITINKKQYFILSFYRTERNENRLSNINKFFMELSIVLDQAVATYNEIILMGDINIDSHDPKSVGYKELSNFLDSYSLKNLIKVKTCFSKEHESSIDVILTNNPRIFYNTFAFELGISDCHKFIGTFLRTTLSKLKPKTLTYRSYKKINEEIFLNDLSNDIKCFDFEVVSDGYEQFIKFFTNLLDKHCPIKTKIVRGNNNRFMNKELSKAIMVRSRLRAKYLKSKNPNDRQHYKKQRNLCVKLRDQAIKADFNKAFSNIKNDSKPFYDIMKPYLTNKGALCCSDIILSENGNIIHSDVDIANIFVDYYTDIVELTSGVAPTNIFDERTPGMSLDSVINNICNSFSQHPSIKK